MTFLNLFRYHFEQLSRSFLQILNLLHQYGQEVNFKQNQQQWSDFTIQQGHIKTDGKGNKIKEDGTSEKL